MGSEYGQSKKKVKIRKNLNEILGPDANKKIHLCNMDLAEYFDTAEEKQFATSVLAGNFKTRHNEVNHCFLGMTPH